MQFAISLNQITLAAADGFRASVCKLDIKSESDLPSIVVPARALGEQTRLLNELGDQNISKKNEDFVKIIKTSKNEAAIEKAKNDLFANNSGFLNKLINSSFNPNLDTELTKADFTQSINEEFGKLINT